MGLILFSFLIILATVLSWLSWGIVIFSIDPQQIGFLGFFFFYFSLLLALFGTIFLVGFFVRFKLQKGSFKITYYLKTSFRQALFFSILIIGSVILQSQGLLTWWNIILFILILTALEFFFITKQKEV